MQKPVLFAFDDSAEGCLLMNEEIPPGTLNSRDLDALGGQILMRGDVRLDREGGDLWALLASGSSLPRRYRFVSRRELPSLFDYNFFVRAGVAFQIMNLHRHNRFCGACGGPMKKHEKDRAMACPSCGHVVYPSLSPAVIMSVEKDGMLLMGRGANFPPGRYSVLAGFVEPGETLEEAVSREVYEESRIRVKNVRYFASQPWPFPNSFMLAFQADWESGEPEADNEEVQSVRWFTPEDLPDIPPSVSISRRLIDDWLGRQGKGKKGE